MPTVDVFNTSRDVVGQLELPEDIFGVLVKPHVMHEVVLYQLAKRRAGTAKTKGRSEISGGGKKPGVRKAPVELEQGPAVRPYGAVAAQYMGPDRGPMISRVPKKVRRLALKMALSQKVLDRELTVLDKLELERIKTKDFVTILDRFQFGKTLVVIPQQDETIEKSARNIPNVKVLRSEGLNVYDLLNYQNVLTTQETVEKLGESLGS